MYTNQPRLGYLISLELPQKAGIVVIYRMLLFKSKTWLLVLMLTLNLCHSLKLLGRVMQRQSRSIALYSSENSIVSRCELKITEAVGSSYCRVKGSNDDPNGSHITIEVVSEIFKGKTSMQRQQMIYKAIWDEMSGPVHAVDSIIAKTPEECS